MARPPVVYIAGRYSAATTEGIELNIQAARHAALVAVQLGWSVVCPHTNFAHLDAADPSIPQQFWLDATMELMRRCDAVVLVDGWQQSHGAQKEREVAIGLGLSLFLGSANLPPPLEFFSDDHTG